MAQLITSSQNRYIKQANQLKKRSHRDKCQEFLIEGFRELSRAATGQVHIEILFICPSLFLGENEDKLIQKIADKQALVLEIPEFLFKKLSFRDRPDGLLAIAKQRHLTLGDLVLPENALLVVAEAIEKPGNLGTILRTSDGVGADALIIVDRCTDLFNPNVVRASVGTCFTIPVVETSSEELFSWLEEKKIDIVATTPHCDLVYTKADLRRSIAIALGTEQYGLSEKWLDKAKIKVNIPMNGVADSLNVAMAATLCLYEALRQRN